MTAESRKMVEQAARLLDVIRSWSLIFGDETTTEPLIFSDYLIIALPLRGHVLENAVTSEGKQNFIVDGTPVLEEEVRYVRE